VQAFLLSGRLRKYCKRVAARHSLVKPSGRSFGATAVLFGLVVDVKKRVSFVWGVKLSSEGDHAFMFVVSSQMVVVRLWGISTS